MGAFRLAVLCAALVGLAASPALAKDRDANVRHVDCSQVQIAVQGQYGDATTLGGDATAEIANEQNITQEQVNACLGSIGNDGNNDEEVTDEETTNEETTAETTTAETTEGSIAEASDLKDGEDDVLAGTDPGGTLPETGGPSGIALAAGCALLGAALIVNRMFR